jgi:hypothetical protein
MFVKIKIPAKKEEKAEKEKKSKKNLHPPPGFEPTRPSRSHEAYSACSMLRLQSYQMF